MARGRKKIVKEEVAKKVTKSAEPQISKDPNAPWHEVKERYGNKLKPKYQDNTRASDKIESKVEVK